MNFGCRSVHAVTAAISIAFFAPGELQAAPEQSSVTLEYSGVAGCPEAGYFKTIVAERLGADVFADNARTRVIVQIASRSQTFEGKMEWLDAKGNWEGDRSFPAHSHDCEDLVRAMAFTLALQLQLSALGNTPPSTPGATPEAHENAAAPHSAPPPPSNEKPAIHPRVAPVQKPEPVQGSRTRPVLAVGAGALIGFGVASNPVPFARVFGSIAWPRWSLELATEANLPTLVQREDGAGFSSQELLASLAGCRDFSPFSACLLAKAGEVRVSGKNIDVPASSTGAILETGLRIKATQRIYRSAYVSVFADGLVLPIRWGVTLDRNVVWTSPRFVEMLGLDVSVHFD